jgi:thioredoxin reductase
MKSFDVLIIGGGVAGMQCALILGSAKNKVFAENKRIGIIIHQKSSHLQNALFNNVLGLEKGTLGSDILTTGKMQLAESYPHIHQLEEEKVTTITSSNYEFTITTNKNTYSCKRAVIALNYSNTLTIKGLKDYVKPHQRAQAKKDRIELNNTNHLIKENLYVCGTIAGWRSQFAIAAGSGASVATDILTIWNDGNHTKIHDKI